jgi:hypothetical protein
MAVPLNEGMALVGALTSFMGKVLGAGENASLGLNRNRNRKRGGVLCARVARYILIVSRILL